MPPLTARHIALSVALGAGLLGAARLLPLARFTPPPAAGALAPGTVRGAVHVHRPLDEESADRQLDAALEAGLDFLVTTTSATLDFAAEGHEGYYTRPGRAGPPLMVLAAAEIPSDRGPLLVLGGPPRAPFPLTRRADEIVAAAHAAGALVIAVRPCRAAPAVGAMAAPDPPDPPIAVDAVEVLSVAADFSTTSWLQLGAGALLAPLRPAGALAALVPADRPVPESVPEAIWRGGAAPLGGIGLDPGHAAGDPEAELVLRAVTTRVVLETEWERTPASLERDRAALLAGIRAGRTLAVAGIWGEPVALSFESPGPSGGWRARLEPPTPADWLLRREGRPVATGRGASMESPAGPGPWRVEVSRRRSDLGLSGTGLLPWIVAAPFPREPGR